MFSLLFAHDSAKALLERQFLLNTPIPRNTAIINLPEKIVLAEGEEVSIGFDLRLTEGYIPSMGKMRWKNLAGKTLIIPIELDEMDKEVFKEFQTIINKYLLYSDEEDCFIINLENEEILIYASFRNYVKRWGYMVLFIAGYVLLNTCIGFSSAPFYQIDIQCYIFDPTPVCTSL